MGRDRSQGHQQDILGCLLIGRRMALQKHPYLMLADSTTTPSVEPIAPTALPNSTDLSSFFTSYMQSQGYTVITPFNKSVNNTTGNDQYSGSITDHKAVYEAVIQLAKSSTDTTNVFNSATSMLKQQGYIPQQTNSTTWIGYNSNANGYLAYVSQDTTDNFVVVLVTAKRVGLRPAFFSFFPLQALLAFLSASGQGGRHFFRANLIKVSLAADL